MDERRRCRACRSCPAWCGLDEVAAGRDPPRPALHRAPHARPPRLPGAPRRRLGRPRAAADGPARPAQGLGGLSGYPRQARVVLQALKPYGMLLADNGSPWYVSGAPSPAFDDDALHALQRIRGPDLEVVDTSRLRNS